MPITKNDTFKQTFVFFKTIPHVLREILRLNFSAVMAFTYAVCRVLDATSYVTFSTLSSVTRIWRDTSISLGYEQKSSSVVQLFRRSDWLATFLAIPHRASSLNKVVVPFVHTVCVRGDFLPKLVPKFRRT
jgi:hypothetical protein